MKSATPKNNRMLCELTVCTVRYLNAITENLRRLPPFHRTYEINQDDGEEIHSELYEIDDDAQDLDQSTDQTLSPTKESHATSNTESDSHEFQCDTCGLAFKSSSTLKVHFKTHNGPVRRHECIDCKKNFKTRLSLTIHRRSHTGERPYVCEVSTQISHIFTADETQSISSLFVTDVRQGVQDSERCQQSSCHSFRGKGIQLSALPVSGIHQGQSENTRSYAQQNPTLFVSILLDEIQYRFQYAQTHTEYP